MSRRQLFDAFRGMWVAATPEEEVRQSLVQKMIEELGYPRELIAIEKELKELPHLQGEASSLAKRRLDIVCFAREIHPEFALFPLLLIECKRRGLSSAARSQVIGYNQSVGAPFVCIAAQDGVETGCYSDEEGGYRFVNTLPPFKRLVEWC